MERDFSKGDVLFPKLLQSLIAEETFLCFAFSDLPKDPIVPSTLIPGKENQVEPSFLRSYWMYVTCCFIGCAGLSAFSLAAGSKIAAITIPSVVGGCGAVDAVTNCYLNAQIREQINILQQEIRAKIKKETKLPESKGNVLQ